MPRRFASGTEAYHRGTTIQGIQLLEESVSETRYGSATPNRTDSGQTYSSVLPLCSLAELNELEREADPCRYRCLMAPPAQASPTNKPPNKVGRLDESSESTPLPLVGGVIATEVEVSSVGLLVCLCCPVGLNRSFSSPLISTKALAVTATTAAPAAPGLACIIASLIALTSPPKVLARLLLALSLGLSTLCITPFPQKNRSYAAHPSVPYTPAHLIPMYLLLPSSRVAFIRTLKEHHLYQHATGYYPIQTRAPTPAPAIQCTATLSLLFD